MRTLTEPIMTQLLSQYNGVIYQAMKQTGIYKSSPDFEDFYQIGCMKLFEAYQTCSEDPLSEEHRYQFVKYSGQKLRWAFLDQKRKDKVHAERIEFDSEEQLEHVPSFDYFETDLEFQEQVAQLINSLTTREFLFLKERFYLGLTITEIAKKHNVSRKTVHQWRNKLQEKASFLREENIY